MMKPPPAASRQAPETKEAAADSSHTIGAAISSALAIRFMAPAAAMRAWEAGSASRATVISAHHARPDRIHPDTLARDFLGQADGEGVDRGLGGGVVAAAGPAAGDRRHGGDVDDRPAAAV